MYKKSLYLAVLTLILSSFAVMLNPLTLAYSDGSVTILVVDNTNASLGYMNISDAILDANTSDIIYVNPGIYHESIVIDKSISVISNDTNSTIINSLGGVYSVLLKSSNATFSGFTVKNSTIGIYLSGSNNTILDNIIINNTNGIYFENSSRYNVLSNNNITNNDDAIILYNSSYNTISNNSIFNNSFFGMKFWDLSANNLIENNKIEECMRGLFLARWSNFNMIFNNTFSPGLSEGSGLLIEDSYYNDVQGNLLLGCKYGLSLTNTHNNTIKNNTFEINDFGIYKKNADEENLSEYNFFYDNGEDVKTFSNPPSIKLPRFEITMVILISFILLFVFLFFPKKKK